jgi:hypothetical protein
MTTYKNDPPRPAGSGVIVKSQEPHKRGVWDLYETTNPRIGMFEVSYWLELQEGVTTSYDEALKELAVFVRDNIKENIVVIEHGHQLVMGGFGSGEAAGRNFLNPPKRRKSTRRDYMIEGYEVRLMWEDAVAFLALWRGHEQSNN